MPAPRRSRFSLTGSLFLAHVVLLTLALSTTGALWVAHHDREIDQHYAARVLAIGRSVAALPEIRDAFALEDPAAAIAPTAARIDRATGAQFIVVANRDGIRYSHPEPHRIGEHVSTPPGAVLHGQEWTGVQTGTQGRSTRAKVPITDTSGAVIGYVSVGVLRSDVDTATAADLPLIIGGIAAVLALGAGGAYLLSRHLRTKTHGLEPAEITALLEGREALLYAVREGVVALTADGRLSLVNAPALEMLELGADCEGRRLADLGLDDRLYDVLSGGDSGGDNIVLVGARVLVCNRRPVRLRGEHAGAVVTLRDRTELDRLTDERDGALTLTRGLRAQSHEFANRIHTVAGMLELGAHEEARAFLDELSAAHTRISAEIGEQVGDSALAALLLAKSAQAAERGSLLHLAPTTELPGELPPGLRSDLLLVVGNLVDNGLDSVAGSGWVEALVRHHPRGDGLPHDLVEVRVTDSGPGVDPALTAEIFTSGFTTKVARDGGERGLGLALVRQTCERRGGSVAVENPAECDDPEEEAYMTFTAYLPVTGAAADGSDGRGAQPGGVPRLGGTAGGGSAAAPPIAVER